MAEDQDEPRWYTIVCSTSWSDYVYGELLTLDSWDELWGQSVVTDDHLGYTQGYWYGTKEVSTILGYAVEEAHEDEVEQLLLLGADPNCVCRWQTHNDDRELSLSALGVAVQSRRGVKMMALLMKYGADPFKAPLAERYTPAWRHDYVPSYEFLSPVEVVGKELQPDEKDVLEEILACFADFDRGAVALFGTWKQGRSPVLNRNTLDRDVLLLILSFYWRSRFDFVSKT